MKNNVTRTFNLAFVSLALATSVALFVLASDSSPFPSAAARFSCLAEPWSGTKSRAALPFWVEVVDARFRGVFNGAKKSSINLFGFCLRPISFRIAQTYIGIVLT